MSRKKLSSATGSVLIKTTLLKSPAEELKCTQMAFLSKQVLSKFSTLLGSDLVLQAVETTKVEARR